MVSRSTGYHKRPTPVVEIGPAGKSGKRRYYSENGSSSGSSVGKKLSKTMRRRQENKRRKKAGKVA